MPLKCSQSARPRSWPTPLLFESFITTRLWCTWALHSERVWLNTVAPTLPGMAKLAIVVRKAENDCRFRGEFERRRIRIIIGTIIGTAAKSNDNLRVGRQIFCVSTSFFCPFALCNEQNYLKGERVTTKVVSRKYLFLCILAIFLALILFVLR